MERIGEAPDMGSTRRGFILEASRKSRGSIEDALGRRTRCHSHISHTVKAQRCASRHICLNTSSVLKNNNHQKTPKDTESGWTPLGKGSCSLMFDLFASASYIIFSKRIMRAISMRTTLMSYQSDLGSKTRNQIMTAALSVVDMCPTPLFLMVLKLVVVSATPPLL